MTDYPVPQVSTDVVALALFDDGLRVLLVRRGAEPFEGREALPGGFVHLDEDVDLEAAARRALAAKTGLSVRHLEQLATFSGPDRDPRGWSVSVVHLALVRGEEPLGVGNDARWVPIEEALAMSLPFDHHAVLEAAMTRVRGKAAYTSLPALMLPDAFTLSELQSLYEAVLGVPLQAAAFRRKVLDQPVLTPVEDEPTDATRGRGRPAQRYRLRHEAALDFGRVVLLPDTRRGG